MRTGSPKSFRRRSDEMEISANASILTAILSMEIVRLDYDMSGSDQSQPPATKENSIPYGHRLHRLQKQAVWHTDLVKDSTHQCLPMAENLDTTSMICRVIETTDKANAQAR